MFLKIEAATCLTREDVVETEHQEFRFKNNLPNGVLILLQEMAFVT